MILGEVRRVAELERAAQVAVSSLKRLYVVNSMSTEMRQGLTQVIQSLEAAFKEVERLVDG